MPSTERCGQESAANKKLGGIPTIHYLNFASKGRGQVIRLLFEDAGIAYDDVRYELPDEYAEFKKTQLAEWNPLATIPVVELDGKILTQSYAILRHFARVLGAYDGQTEDEKFWADRICDAALDWRTCFVNAFLSPNKEKDYPEHCKTKRVDFLKGINQLLTSSELSGRGPYVIGQEITYADLVLYQVIHDEGLSKDDRKGLKEGGYDRLVAFTDAVESRPNVAAFLKSSRYRG